MECTSELRNCFSRSLETLGRRLAWELFIFIRRNKNEIHWPFATISFITNLCTSAMRYVQKFVSVEPELRIRMVKQVSSELHFSRTLIKSNLEHCERKICLISFQ